MDELYDLAADPFETKNLAEDLAHRDRLKALMARMWAMIRDTGDRTLWNSQYPGLRLAAVGPEAAEDG